MSATAEMIENTIEMQPGIVTELPLECVGLDPEQPRKDIDADYIGELAADIKLRGVKQPITVRANPEAPGRYLVKYGECRLRASVAAGKETVPALLDTEEGADDGLSRLLDQVKENHIRRDLNPMEWAGVLRRLRDDHKIKSMANIEQTLRDHGITNMGRAYISNIMRLAELPEWAQNLIRTGELTAAHGKYLLSAVRSESVMESLEQELTGENADIPSVRGLQEMIFESFEGCHQRLDAVWNGPLFDYKTECAGAGCQKMRKISDERRSGTFCLDEECYNAKSTAARKAQKDATQSARDAHNAGDDHVAAPTVSDDGTVDIDEQEDSVDWITLERASFDIEPCKACPHCHTATSFDYEDDDGNPVRTQFLACFEGLQCYHEKVRAIQQELARLSEAREQIEYWLRDLLAERIASDVDVQLAIIGLAAIGAPIDYDILEEAPEKTGVNGIEDLLRDGLMAHSEKLAAHLVTGLDLDLLIPLAKEARVELEEFRIGRGYFESLCRFHNGKLVDYLTGTEHYTADDREKLVTESDGELIERAINASVDAKITDEIAEAWKKAMDTPKDAEAE